MEQEEKLLILSGDIIHIATFIFVFLPVSLLAYPYSYLFTYILHVCLSV